MNVTYCNIEAELVRRAANQEINISVVIGVVTGIAVIIQILMAKSQLQTDWVHNVYELKRFHDIERPGKMVTFLIDSRLGWSRQKPANVWIGIVHPGLESFVQADSKLNVSLPLV